MYRAGVNKVIVKLDPDFTMSGIFRLVEDVKHLQVTGTVEDVGRGINPRMSKIVNDWTRAYYRELPNPDVSTLTPLKKGDRVVFSYLSKLDEDCFLSEDLLIIERGLIFGKGNPFTGINGYLLLQMHEKQKVETHGNIVVVNEDVNKYGIGSNEEGEWGFLKNNAFRAELDIHNTLTKGQSSLFVVKKEYAWQITSMDKSLRN